jgi:hypothetical protein
MATHFFTPAEANALLPEVRRIVGRMLEARQEVLALHPELWPVVAQAANNGGSKVVTQATRQILVIQEALHRLEALGIQVKDLNTGLIDFPARRRGQTVLLCWLYDEPSVQWWHDLESGFAGRQPITDWE